MTDMNSLFEYRWNLALETLEDAKKFLEIDGSPRSVVNRAYYAMFYAVLALFIKTNTSARTSKHSTVISIFDQEFIKTQKLSRDLSQMLHRAFDDRQEFDYKDYVQVEKTDAEDVLGDAVLFIKSVEMFLNTNAS